MNWVEKFNEFAENSGLWFSYSTERRPDGFTTLQFKNPKTQAGYLHRVLTGELNTTSSCNRAISEICYRAEKALL